MLLRRAAALAFLVFCVSAQAQDDGVVQVKSAHTMSDTIVRLKQDIAAKGILFFSEVDQSGLAAQSGISIRPSTLLTFGNPPLGTLFIRAKAEAGLDWPVRLLVHQNEQGEVWAVYTDFAWIARRHGLSGEAAKPFETVAEVVTSITSRVKTN